jgi:hypothetical protein
MRVPPQRALIRWMAWELGTGQVAPDGSGKDY